MTHSYSDVLTAQRCLRKYYYANVLKIQPKARNKNMTKGQFFHRLLMGHYLGEDMDALYDELLVEAGKYLINDEVATAVDLLNEAYDMVERYLTFHADDEWEVLHVEETFTARTAGGVEISFTPDLIIRDATGVWIVDHKTTDRMPSAELPVGNLQAFLYSSVIREVYPDFRGFIFNYVRKKVPTEPRLTKTGEKRVADIGRIDTTYEMLRDFLMEEAPELLSDPAHQRRLAELKDNSKFFWRQHIFVTDDMADQILAEVEFTTQLIDLAIDNNMFPRSFLPYAGAQECDNCAYKDICIAELRGYDTKQIMFLYEDRDMSYRNYDSDTEDLITWRA